MFAFALWDRRERTLVLARDRLGEKPLYYGRIGKSFAFASELKAFRAHPAWNAEIDRDALALFMRHNYVPAPYSIYKGFCKLRPGHFLVLADGDRDAAHRGLLERARRSRSRRGPVPSRAAATRPSPRSKQVLTQSVQGQMMADVPLGAFLSGGIDSSTVVALMQSMSSQPVRTFTIGFHQAGYNEAEHAKAGRTASRHRSHRALRDRTGGDGCHSRAAADLLRAVLRLLADSDLSGLEAGAAERHRFPVGRRRR